MLNLWNEVRNQLPVTVQRLEHLHFPLLERFVRLGEELPDESREELERLLRKSPGPGEP